MRRRRLTPYTARGVKRMRCAYRGCRRRGYADWKVCADDEHRAICYVHDIELNFLVLEVLGDRQAKAKSAVYAAHVIRAVNQRGQNGRP